MNSSVNLHREHPHRLHAPSAEQLARYAENLRLPLSDLDRLSDEVAAHLEVFDRIAALPQPEPPLRYPYRDPGRAPRDDEDPCNAILRFCDVRGASTGPLADKRLAVKDCLAVAGIPMTAGGTRYPVVIPAEDAVVVERVLDAGASIVATTSMPDLALGLGLRTSRGPVRNPHDRRFAAGGSSSGSAAAVASGMVHAALGTDQGGSVRIPAAWCGIVGMKATHGLVPTHGMTPVDPTFDHIGPMTRTVADSATVLSVIAHDPDRKVPDYQSTADRGVRGLRFGVVTESVAPARCGTGTLRAFDEAVASVKRLGGTVEPVSVPLWPHAATIAMALTGFGLLSMAHSYGQGYGHLGRVDLAVVAATAAQHRLSAHDLPFSLRTRLLAVEHLRQAYFGVPYGKARNLRAEFSRQVHKVLSQVDLLLTPTTPAGPVLLPDDEDTADPQAVDAVYNTCPFSLTGMPALTLPAGTGDHDLPAGLQIAARRFDEHTVYQAAFAIEAEFEKGTV